MRPTLNQVLLHQVPATPWRNGGGRTHELLAWPTLDAWQLRISVAVIDCDGAFSAYPGVARCFAVLAGAGVRLHFAQFVQTLEVGSPVLQFDGADAPGCKLIDGPTQDLNLMCPHSAGRADMAAADDQPWHRAAPLRACYSHTAASLHTGAAAPLALPAQCLVWDAHSASQTWTLVGAEEPLQAWWMWFTPAPDATHTV